MATAVWVLGLCLCSILSVSSAIDATILEGQSEAFVGSNFTLHCHINLTSTGLNASHVVWRKDFENQIDHHPMSVFNESVAQLHIVNASVQDSGTYFCAFPSDGYWNYVATAASVHFGFAPEPVRNLRCFTTNINDFTCTWEDGRNTHLRTTDTLYYQTGLQREIVACRPHGEENICKISLLGSTTIHVESENALGNSTAKLGRIFDPFSEVRPNAPEDVLVTAPNLRELRVSYRIPSDWPPQSHFGLVVWLQYRSANSVWTNITREIHNLANPQDIVIRNLRPYTTYYTRISLAYDVLVKNLASNVYGTWSEEVEQFTRAEVPEASISGLKIASQLDDSNDPNFRRWVTLTWQPLPEEDYRGPGFRYNVSIENQDGLVKYMTTTNTIEIVEDLDKYEEYIIHVTPYNQVGRGINSATKHLEDKTSTPRVPHNVRVWPTSSTSVQVTWEEPREITGYITAYLLEWRELYANGDENRFEHTLLANLTHIVDNLKPSTVYQFGILSRNKLGDGSWAYTNVETFEAAPVGPPQSVVVAPDAAFPKQLVATWQPPPDEMQNGNILSYTINYCQCGESTPATPDLCQDGKTVSVAELETTVPDLSPFTDYCVWIAASTAIGAGPWSPLVRQRTSEGTPDAPQNLMMTFKNASVIHLSWDPPASLNGQLRYYEVSYGSSGFERVHAPSAVLSVEGFRNYTIKVQACSHGEPSIACGSFSEPVYVMTDIGVPEQVQNLELFPDTPKSVKLNWMQPLVPNGPVDYYVIRTRPSDSDEEWHKMEWHKKLSETASVRVKVDCSLVDGKSLYDFEVLAVNKVNGVSMLGPESSTKQYEMCNIHSAPAATIVLSIILPGVVVAIAFFVVIWVKQSDFFKPAPDPYFIEAVLDHSDDKFQMKGRLLNMRTEKENFNALRQADSTTNLLLPPYDRLSSKESTSTNSSTDQGIHDMDGFTEEMRYAGEKTNSRNQSESDEEKLPAKHAMCITSDDYEDEEDTVFKGGRKKHEDCDGSISYSRIAEADAADSSTPMLAKESAQYLSDGSEAYAQLSQVTPQTSTTPPATLRGLAEQASEASFGSESTVNYHRLGMTGLTPITSVETLPSDDPLAYSRLSQGSETDIEYSQLAAATSNNSLTEAAGNQAGDNGDESSGTDHRAGDGRGVAMSLPSVSAASRIEPQQEFIVATALAPGSHPQPVSQPDSAGYVTSLPVPKPTEPMPKSTGEEPNPELEIKCKKLAESKLQSGSDSSLTDGEGYSTLGFADPPSNSVPHHQQPKVAAASNLQPPSPAQFNIPLSNGYIPNNIAPAQTSAPDSHRTTTDKTPVNGYVTESDLKALTQPSALMKGDQGKKEKPMSQSGRHKPQGLLKVGENGYVASEDIPPAALPQTVSASNEVNPYITHEQAAQMPTRATAPPSTPTPLPLLNNNQPLPPGKKFCVDAPYVDIGRNVSVSSPSITNENESTVC